MTRSTAGFSVAMIFLGACSSAPTNIDFQVGKCTPTATYRYVNNQVKLPGLMTSYAYDIDGDSSPDNGLQPLIAGMKMVGFDADGMMSNQVSTGKTPMLIEVAASDLQNGCAVVTLQTGAPTSGPPKFDNKDQLATMSGAPKVVLPAAIHDGFLTTLPPNQFMPAMMTPLVLTVTTVSGMPLPLPLYGVHVQGKLTATSLDGELHGVVRQTDMNNQLLPATAQLFTAQINRTTITSQMMYRSMLVSYFEDQSTSASKSKCTSTPAQCCATNPTTCQITTAELTGNSKLMSLLAPDVQAFQNGSWGPMADGSSKDASSFGMGLSAVKAMY